MRGALRSSLALLALSAVAAGGACNLFLGLPADTEDAAEKVAQFCSCMDDQGAEFTDRCTQGAQDLEPEILLAVAEKGCASCDEAEKAKIVAKCYGDITNAKGLGEGCALSTECESFACGVAQFGLDQDGNPIYTGTCVESCERCSTPVEAVGYCVEAAEILGDLFVCLCNFRKEPVLPRCGGVTECGGVTAGCDRVIEEGCGACLLADPDYQGQCDVFIDACAADRPRPTVTSQ